MNPVQAVYPTTNNLVVIFQNDIQKLAVGMPNVLTISAVSAIIPNMTVLFSDPLSDFAELNPSTLQKQSPYY